MAEAGLDRFPSLKRFLSSYLSKGPNSAPSELHAAIIQFRLKEGFACEALARELSQIISSEGDHNEFLPLLPGPGDTGRVRVCNLSELAKGARLSREQAIKFVSRIREGEAGQVPFSAPNTSGATADITEIGNELRCEGENRFILRTQMAEYVAGHGYGQRWEETAIKTHDEIVQSFTGLRMPRELEFALLLSELWDALRKDLPLLGQETPVAEEARAALREKQPAMKAEQYARAQALMQAISDIEFYGIQPQWDWQCIKWPGLS